jgi:hypothetical protein
MLVWKVYSTLHIIQLISSVLIDLLLDCVRVLRSIHSCVLSHAGVLMICMLCFANLQVVLQAKPGNSEVVRQLLEVRHSCCYINILV